MFNLAANPALGAVGADKLVHVSDEEMVRGTLTERVQQQEKARHEAFLNLLKEKQDAVDRTQTESLLVCKKCGSNNINFVQVQTRSADEPMTYAFFFFSLLRILTSSCVAGAF